MINFTTITLCITAITTALIAGLFYAYSCSVNPGLGKLPDKEYIAAMQAINVAIINPVFMLSFIGSLILLPLSAYMHYAKPIPTRFILPSIASLIYIIGTFGVTIFGNVPLNASLASCDVQSANIQEVEVQRANLKDHGTVCIPLEQLLLLPHCRLLSSPVCMMTKTIKSKIEEISSLPLPGYLEVWHRYRRITLIV